jgi:predicted MFS family arabinose efflux permease
MGIPMNPSPPPTQLRVQLAALILARLMMNIGLRMVYPFAPELGRGLGVEVTEVYRLITIRNLAGFLSPFFGPLSERYGRKPIIIAATLLFAASCFLVVRWPAYWALGLTLVLIAIAKIIYDPALQAYLGDSIPYRQRGRAIAISEVAWAGALLVGAPTVGWLIARQGWQAPFLWLGLLALLAAVWLWRVLPPITNQTRRGLKVTEIGGVLRQHPVIWAAIAYSMLVAGGSETFFIVYGDWMETTFSLSLGGLGLTASVVGVAEIFGEGAVGVFVDRFGKRFIVTARLLSALAYSIIPFASQTIALALITLFTLFLFFEMMVVGAVPLLTELVPSARSMVIAAVVAASSLGRAGGTILGPFLWERGGLAANGLVAAALTLVGMGVLVRWLHVDSSQ